MNNGATRLALLVRRLTKRVEIGIAFGGKTKMFRLLILSLALTVFGTALLVGWTGRTVRASNSPERSTVSQIRFGSFRLSSFFSNNNPPTPTTDIYTGLAARHQNAPGLLGNDADPDGDPLHIITAPVVNPQHGSVNLYGDGSFYYTPNATYAGTDSFTYQVCDNQGGCANAVVTLNNANHAATLGNDTFSGLGARHQVAPGVLGNDSDSDGDALQIDLSFNYQAQHGYVTLYGSGEFYYGPAYGYVGPDSFSYRVCDSFGACSTATVTLNDANTAPLVVADFYVGTAASFQAPTPVRNVLTNDRDLEGDQRTVDLGTSGGNTQQHGFVNIYANGDFYYSPPAGFSGTDWFTYTSRDSLGAASTAVVYLFVSTSGSAPVPYSCPPIDPKCQSSFNPQTGGFAQVSGGVTGASGPSKGDPVNLATGRESYAPAPDLTVYNPSGPTVVWQRVYFSDRALTGLSGDGSPGFSRGWVHNYDVTVQATSGSWGALKLTYPNGATETLTPQLSGGQPTGAFTTGSGGPYIVTGIPGSPTGTWQSITVTWKDQTKWKFTQLSGTTYPLSQLTNRTGQSLNFNWNSSRALTQVSDATTSTVLLTLAYSANGQLATATDTYGRKVTYTFTTASSTATSNLQSVSQVVTSATSNPPAHYSYTYTAESGQQLNTITVPSPTGSGTSTATINYNSAGKVTSLVDANGNQRVYTYNTGTTQVQVKDSANNIALSWTQNFNSSGLDTGITDAANHSTTVAYTDTANPLKPTSVIDRNGHTTTYTYDQFGNVLTVTTPRSITTTYNWEYSNFALGRLSSVREGTKPATTITYFEPSGLVHTVTQPEPNNGTGTTTTTYTFDTLGNVLTIVTPGNNAATTITTTFNHTSDGAYSQAAKIGQPLTVTDNLGHVTHLRYDSQGRTISVTDALGNETDFSYNLGGQPETTTFPATGQTGSGHSHTTSSYLYVGGPLTSVTAFDESNTQVRQMTRSYGLEGESLAVSGSTEPVTNTYDALYRLKTLKDGNNNTTTYAYNNIGLLSSITMPGSETTQFTSYDNDGNLLQRIDGNNVTTNYVYNDSESLLTDIQYPATTSLNVHFTYDSYGRRSVMTDGTGSQSYSYGNLDELLSASTTYTGLSAKTISYAYYPNGNRQSMSTPAGTFSYSYDAAGRPTSLTNPFSETTNWAYQNNNWLSTQSLANGTVATYTHNALGQVTELLNQIGSTTISDFSSITYDGVGNRTSVSASIPGASSLSGITGYSYDSKDQITQETSTRNGGFTDNFGYDPAGNPTNFKGIIKSYNSNNQQTGSGFSYDGNGNPTNHTGLTLTFDPENRMTAYSSVLTAAYTGDGLRAWKQNASGRTYFVYDGTLAVAEINSTDSVTSSNTFGVNGLISRRSSSATTFYNFDSEGSIAHRSDSGGNILSEHLFSAHGSVLQTDLSDPFGYKAQYAYYSDIETRLQLLTHRYYDQNLGRFLTRDPIGYNGGINVFAYVHNSPVKNIDPLGLDDADKPWYIEDKPWYPPGTSRTPKPFDDGGIFSAASLSEFISANERARQPCKRFGERFSDSFSETNRALPGALAPTGFGMITSGELAAIAGEPTAWGWISTGFTPPNAFGGILMRGGFNFVMVGGAYESGVAIGSYVDAMGCPCGY
jgi:RHS repeat-associated protein